MSSIIKISLIGLLYFIFVNAKCSKKICTGNNDGYSFNMNASLYPNYDSINVNDTLWLEIAGATTLKDNNSGTMINYSNAANLGTVVSLIELLGNSNYRGAYDDFQLHLKNGTIVFNNYDPARLKEYSFNEKNNEYIFQLGFIPQKKGIYRIAFENAVNVYRSNDVCTKSAFGFSIKNTNCHSYYNNLNFSINNTDSTRLYCFKVK